MANLDFWLDADGDIALDGDDLVLVAGVELVTQRIIVGLRLFLGEWFLEEEGGMPYWRDVLCDQPKSALVEAMFRRAILADEDIERIDEFTMTADKTYRRVTVDFRATSRWGVVNVSEVFP